LALKPSQPISPGNFNSIGNSSICPPVFSIKFRE
jgi:hypothetical protein